MVPQWVAARLPVGIFGQRRAELYRLAGFTGISTGVHIQGELELRGDGDIWSALTIAEGAFINAHCWFDVSAPVRIGPRASIGHHVLLITSDHDASDPGHRCGAHRPSPIRIGEGAWLGASVIVLPGVTIGKGAVVVAGAVVTKDVPPNARVAGNPARVMGWLEDANPAGGDHPGAAPFLATARRASENRVAASSGR